MRPIPSSQPRADATDGSKTPDELTDLFQSLYPELIHFARSVFHLQIADAEDLMMEVLESILRSETGNPSACLTYPLVYYKAALKNRMVSLYRLRVRRKEISDDVLLTMMSNGPTPEEALLREEQKERIRELINELPLNQQIVVSLNYSLELSVWEIARRLGKSVTAITSTLYRARKKLRKQIEQLQGLEEWEIIETPYEKTCEFRTRKSGMEGGLMEYATKEELE